MCQIELFKVMDYNYIDLRCLSFVTSINLISPRRILFSCHYLHIIGHTALIRLSECRFLTYHHHLILDLVPLTTIIPQAFQSYSHSIKMYSKYPESVVTVCHDSIEMIKRSSTWVLYSSSLPPPPHPQPPPY